MNKKAEKKQRYFFLFTVVGNLHKNSSNMPDSLQPAVS
jgi:hypothetical protein